MTEPTQPNVRTTVRGHRFRTAAGLGLLGLALALAGCSFDADEPATVTLPENNTTTTLPRESLAPRTTDPEPPEPLPIAWKLQVGGPGDDRLMAVTGDQASVVAVGDTTGGLGTPVEGRTDVFITSVTTEGEVVGVEQAGSGGSDDATGVTANETDVLTCGSTDGIFGAAPGGKLDVWCSPVVDGALSGEVRQLGSSDDERITGVALAADDDLAYASGTLGGLFPGAQDPSGRGLGGGDALALQTDGSGRPIWARQFGTSLEEGATGVTTTEDGDGIFTGYTDGDLEGASNGGRDAWISRFDTTGNQRWVTQIGSPGTDSFAGVTATGEARRGTEQFVAAGTTDGDLDGDGPDVALGATDAMVGSFGTDGALLWTAQFGSAGSETVSGVVADGSIIYVTGTTDGGFGTLLEDGGPGGATDIFLAALDAGTGEVLWSSRVGTEGDDRSNGIATTEDGVLVVVGTTTGQFADTPPNGGVDGVLVAFPLASSGGGAASSV